MTEGPAPTRRFPRLASRHAVLLRKLASDAFEQLAPTKSIALGGCCLLSDSPVGIGAPVELLISVDHRVVSARGNVVYEHPAEDGRTEVGVQFRGLEDEASDAIRQLFDAPTEE